MFALFSDLTSFFQTMVKVLLEKNFFEKMIKDNSTCIPVAPPPLLKPMDLPHFPVGEEFIIKNKEETAPQEKIKD